MQISFDKIFTVVLSAAIFFLGWQLRTFSIILQNLKEDLKEMYKVLIDHITDYDIHNKKE